MMKRILSFLLAFLMVVSIFPAPAYATDSTDVTITPTETPTEAATETPCPTCGTVGCTSEHLTWCPECKVDDCGKTHVFCEICQKNDCGQNHCPTCGTIDCTTDHGAPAAETPEEPEVHPMVGKVVKLKSDLTSYSGYRGENLSVTLMSKDGYPSVMKVTAVLEKNDVVYCRLTAVEGSWSFPEYDDNFYLESTKLEAAVWCTECEEYDCGEDHSQPPVEPENPCACCESCTGAEGCTCECGACDFCEKTEEPTVPSISATVNGQTVTVSGAALPEGATLTVTDAVPDLDGGFAYDIKIRDTNGNEWQPLDSQSVTLSIPVPGVADGNYIELIHLLENETAIQKAISEGNVWTEEGVDDVYPAASEAYRTLTGKENTFAFEVFKLKAKNGIVKAPVSSFSIYFWTGSSFISTVAGVSDDIIFHDTLTSDRSTETFYVTPGQVLRCNRGGVAVTSRKWRFSGLSLTANEELEGAHGSEIMFTVPSNAAVGTNFYIECSILKVFTWSSWNRVNFVVVEERTVNFNGNGGTAGASSLTAIKGDSSHNQNITLPNATRSGYTFLGWYTAASGGTRKGGAGTSYMPDSNGETLYAQWEPIKYTVKFHANGGSNSVTGSMPTLNMTYDVETTLPRNQFINQGDGMVFLGWATSADGEVVYKDGAKIKNLTATNNGTVTLYAKWKYGLASTVYIGINNTYHNPKGTYTAGGVTINSYHTYPNEPAQMTGDFDRVTDTSGGWTYNSESAVPLKNQAASYINGNIFNSPDYEMTYVEGENTLGIADPTGDAVRAMLKFSEADYQAMITAWLNGMRSTLTGYGDTSVDWQNAKPEDFVMVPYVIKFQNYDSWYIDMVVKPKALYTLAYDGNIENGYTASFTGVAFPPSAQHTEGTNVSVVSTPIGYQNNNLKVTKVIDGHTYTAEFQYWYDAKGNTYGGSTGRNTITLTEDTILYAKWNYPDASFGNLNITKTVVDRDAYEDPSATQSFTFKFTTNAAGSYSYTIYDRAANVKATGTIANNGTFTLQDGWRIRITDLPKGATYTVTETAVNYYTASGTVSGTISAGATTYATVTNTFQKNAGYTVKHFLQNADKNGYTELGDSAEKLHGVIGTDTVAAAKNYNGYTPHAVVQKKIQADGKTVIEIYYNLIAEAAIKWNAGEGQFIDGTKEKQTSHEYGAIPTPPEQPSKESTAEFTYTFDKWTPTIVEVTGDTTYTATYSQTKNKYNVTGIIDNDGEVTNTPQSVEYGEANLAMVFTPAQGYEISGVSVNGEPVATFDPSSYSFCQTITKDTTVEVTTSCVEYTISYELNGGLLADGVTNPATYTVVTETFTLNNPTRAGYKFKGWATSENATTGTESITIEKGTTGDKTFYAVWERSLVDLTITATTADTNQNFIFTVSGTRSDGVAFASIDVVLCSKNGFTVTIKDLPVGIYDVTEKDGWSWRENAVGSKTADLRTTSQTVSFDFYAVDDLHWLSGYSYKRKKGGS